MTLGYRCYDLINDSFPFGNLFVAASSSLLVKGGTVMSIIGSIHTGVVSQLTSGRLGKRPSTISNSLPADSAPAGFDLILFVTILYARPHGSASTLSMRTLHALSWADLIATLRVFRALLKFAYFSALGSPLRPTLCYFLSVAIHMRLSVAISSFHQKADLRCVAIFLDGITRLHTSYVYLRRPFTNRV